MSSLRDPGTLGDLRYDLVEMLAELPDLSRAVLRGSRTGFVQLGVDDDAYLFEVRVPDGVDVPASLSGWDGPDDLGIRSATAPHPLDEDDARPWAAALADGLATLADDLDDVTYDAWVDDGDEEQGGLVLWLRGIAGPS